MSVSFVSRESHHPYSERSENSQEENGREAPCLVKQIALRNLNVEPVSDNLYDDDCHRLNLISQKTSASCCSMM